MEQDVAFLERHEPRLPLGWDRAFLRQQWARSELEDDLAELGIIDPIVPLVEAPDAAGHDDRNAVGDALLAHRFAQRLDARIRVLRLARVFGIGEAVMPASEPRVLVDDGGEPLRGLVIGTLPQ